MNLKETDVKYVANTYSRFPIEIVSGSGSLCYDESGKEYIDLGSGIAVNTFGYSDEEWVCAVEKQLRCVSHTSNLYYTSPCVLLAKELCVRTGMEKVFFANSGAEANECAIKAARLWAEREKGSECSTIITLKNGFHGRTVTTLAATGQDVFHMHFMPLTPGFVYVEANNAAALEDALSKNKCAAVMLELIQGEGGVTVMDKDYIKSVVRLCEEKNALLIIDEVQTGNGRTGKLYAYMHYDIKPDIFTTAKGLGGGLPIGAAIFGKKTADVYSPGLHGSTFGANPVCCSGALNVLSRLDEELLNGVCKRSEYIFSELSSSRGIKGVYGMGLMIGVETERDLSAVINECIKDGVLVLRAKNRLRLLPPLNIPMPLLKKGINVIKKAAAI